jgi:menaquinone-9 beta-reductase
VVGLSAAPLTSNQPPPEAHAHWLGPRPVLTELTSLGVAENPRFAYTNATRVAGLHIDGEHVLTDTIRLLDRAPSAGRVIPRVLLDTWLVNAAVHAGARLLEEHTVSSYEYTRDGVVVIARRNGMERRLRARLVIGADGSASAIARTLRGGSHPRTDTIVASPSAATTITSRATSGVAICTSAATTSPGTVGCSRPAEVPRTSGSGCRPN